MQPRVVLILSNHLDNYSFYAAPQLHSSLSPWQKTIQLLQPNVIRPGAAPNQNPKIYKPRSELNNMKRSDVCALHKVFDTLQLCIDAEAECATKPADAERGLKRRMIRNTHGRIPRIIDDLLRNLSSKPVLVQKTHPVWAQEQLHQHPSQCSRRLSR